MNKNLNDIMNNWGSAHRKTSLKSEALKETVLAKVPLVSYPLQTPQPKANFKWASLGFATMSLAVLVLSFINNPTGINNITTISLPTDNGGGDGAMMPTVSYGGEKDMPNAGVNNQAYEVATESSFTIARDMYYPGYSLPPITDNREFLKTSYNASIRTRDVTSTGAKIETIVRGSTGRVDSSSLGDEYGHVSFSIPSDKFILFREQIKDLTHAKLFTENINSENLLPQKQSIEERQEEVDKNLSTLTAKRAEIIKNHNYAESIYQQQTSKLQTEENLLLAELYRNMATPERKAEINIRLQQISAEKSAINTNRSNENRNYKNKLAQIDEEIKWAEENKQYIEKEDKNFAENLDTVSGYISLTKINLWGIADLYAPGPLLAWLLGVGALFSYFRYKASLRVYEFH
jgi:hypothetical protein